MTTDKTHKDEKLNVLSLEDSARDFELIKELLIDAGYLLSIEWVETEDAFTASLRSTSYDIILADFKLPGFDAFGALHIRNEICPDSPFICVSGSIGEETAIELLKAGAVDYVIKDRPERLPFAVGRALEEAREKKKRQQNEEALKEAYRQLKTSQNATLSILKDLKAEGRAKQAREAELKQQKTQLEQRNRALKQFNYAVSHELKTPLVTIESSLGLIQDTLPRALDPELTRVFSYTRHATRQMNNLLESLQLMFRIDTADSDTEASAFRVLVQDAVDHLTGENKLEGITLTITAEGPELCGDRHKLVQIWLHLIGNAAKYMGDQKHPAIDIGIEQTGQEVIFYVRDNGIGIEKAYQGKIFGLFDKLDKTADGTGLGLTLVQRIVDYYGGTIWVESAGISQGSCLYFTLPDVLINKDATR